MNVPVAGKVRIRKDWRTIVRRHWSVRWWAAAILLSFLEAFLTAAQSYLPVQVNPIFVSIAIAFCASAGLACKFIAQGGLGNAD